LDLGEERRGADVVSKILSPDSVAFVLRRRERLLLKQKLLQSIREGHLGRALALVPEKLFGSLELPNYAGL